MFRIQFPAGPSRCGTNGRTGARRPRRAACLLIEALEVIQVPAIAIPGGLAADVLMGPLPHAVAVPQHTASTVHAAAAPADPTAATAPPITNVARPGFQLIVIGKYSTGPSSSLQNFIDVVTAPGSPQKLEVAFASRLPGYESAAYAQGVYERARTLVKALTESGKDYVLTVHFGLHDMADPDASPTYRQTLTAQAGYLKAFLNSIVVINGRNTAVKDAAGLKVVACPSLEDGYPTNASFQAAVKVIAGQLTASELDHVSFRRASTDPGQLVGTSRSIAGVRSSDGKTRSVTVAREYHGALVPAATQFEVYSNDGQFVYSPWDLNRFGGVDENSKSAENADYGLFPTRPPFDQFLRDAAKTFAGRSASNLTVNLWRPAYNLYPVDQLGAGTDSNPELKHYDMKRPLSQRTDGIGVAARISVLEQRMMRIFVGLPLK